MKKIFALIAVLLIVAIVYLFLPSNYFLRQALLHLEPNIDDNKIFYHRLIENGVPQRWKIDSSYNTSQLTQPEIDSLEKYSTVAFLVIKDNALLYEHYWQGYGDSSYSNSFSMSKSIVSLLIGCALEEGKIQSLNQTVSSILPDFVDLPEKPVTIENLLTMSAGLNFHEEYASPFSDPTKLYYTDDLNALVYSTIKQVKPAGVKFIYQSAATQLLTMILEKQTGESVSHYASKKLWKPLGAEHQAQWSLDHEDGIEKGYCCFYSNARDFARIGQLMLNKGWWNGVEVVPQSYMEKALTPATYLQVEPVDVTNDQYGYQFWQLQYQGYTVNYCRGILGQYIFTIPALNVVIVRLGEERSTVRSSQYYTIDVDSWLSIGLRIVANK